MHAAGPATRPSPIRTMRRLPRPPRKAAAGTKAAPVDVTEVEERLPDTYDRIFGVIDGGLSTGEGAA